MEVERGADADEHGASRRSRISRIQISCLGWPMPTHTTSALGAVDVLDDPVLLVVGQRAEGRRVAADDLQAGEAAAQAQRELDERALVAAAVQVHAVTPVSALRSQYFAMRSGP